MISSTVLFLSQLCNVHSVIFDIFSLYQTGAVIPLLYLVWGRFDTREIKTDKGAPWRCKKMKMAADDVEHFAESTILSELNKPDGIFSLQ